MAELFNVGGEIVKKYCSKVWEEPDLPIEVVTDVTDCKEEQTQLVWEELLRTWSYGSDDAVLLYETLMFAEDGESGS